MIDPDRFIQTFKMNEQEIKNILKSDQFSDKTFVGVYSRTRIPITNKIPAGYIINLDEFGSEGIHWISVYITHNRILVFDSYGGNYLNDSMLSSFLQSYSNKRKIISSPIVLQQNLSSTCGLYCILFICYMSRQYSFHEFVNQFSKKDQLVNDLAIVDFFSTYYNKDFKQLL